MTFNHVNRRTHLYLALFLMPWFLMFGLSSLAIQHRWLFGADQPNAANEWTKRFDRQYDLVVPEDVDLREVGAKILSDAGLSGAFFINRAGNDSIRVNQFNFSSGIRLTYNMVERRLIAEEQQFSFHQKLIRMHVRGGFEQDSVLDDFWAATIDLVCLAFVLWILSGLYMWWKIPRTRIWGMLTLVAGIASFCAFLGTL